eukprot:2449999-Pyramimonas_sp.AAC.2
MHFVVVCHQGKRLDAVHVGDVCTPDVPPRSLRKLGVEVTVWLRRHPAQAAANFGTDSITDTHAQSDGAHAIITHLMPREPPRDSSCSAWGHSQTTAHKGRINKFLHPAACRPPPTHLCARPALLWTASASAAGFWFGRGSLTCSAPPDRCNIAWRCTAAEPSASAAS